MNHRLTTAVVIGVLATSTALHLQSAKAVENPPPTQQETPKNDPTQPSPTTVPDAKQPAPVLKIPGRAGPEEQFIQSAILDLHRTTEISRLASDRAQDVEIKQLASTVAADLSAMSQDLIGLAQRKGVENPLEEVKTVEATKEGAATRRELSQFSRTPLTKPVDETEKPSATDPAAVQVTKPSPDPVSRDLVQKLQALYGDAFDRRYLKELSRSHGKATQNCEQASRYMVDEDLKKFSMSTLPKLQEHRQRIAELAQRKNIDLDSQEQARR
ncbi:MAG: DUF4142 domain-containing protein [Verrucomicrobiales bacterium]|nr:DUF4142 domain-containing protein [Verrucomicrobiales bacterium]